MSVKSIQKTLEYQRIVLEDNLEYFKPNHSKKQRTFAEEITLSLQHKSKYISPKYFYDNIGSQLFDRICQLPEYYPIIVNLQSSKILQKISCHTS